MSMHNTQGPVPRRQPAWPGEAAYGFPSVPSPSSSAAFGGFGVGGGAGRRHHHQQHHQRREGAATALVGGEFLFFTKIVERGC